MKQKLKLFIVFCILITIPLTVLLAQHVQIFINQAAGPDRKLIMGISLPVQTLDYLDAFSRGIKQYPGTFSIWNEFGSDGNTNTAFSNQALLDGLHARNITPVIFLYPAGPQIYKSNPSNTKQGAMKYSNAKIANGSFDNYLRLWANAAAAYNKPVIVRYAWEMNGNWFPWSATPANGYKDDAYFDVGNTPANYVAAWRHVYNVIHPIAPKVKFYWCSTPGTSMNGYFPGVNYVDYVGFDAYDSLTRDQTMVDLYDNPIKNIRTLVMGNPNTPSSKPIIVGETGIDLRFPNPKRSDWLTNGYNSIYSKFPDVAAILYFNFGNWELNSNGDLPENEIASAYVNLASQPKFQGRFPPFTASPPPTPAPTVNNPIGYHDGSNCSVSNGWTCDADNYNQPLDVHFYADGPAGSGTFIGATTASVAREAGVGSACGGNNNHGFSFATPQGLKNGQNHSIYAYSINIGSGNYNPLLGNSPKIINCAAPTPTFTPTPTPTPSPTPTPTPSPTPTFTPTPTPRPTATPTNIPTTIPTAPITAAPQETILKFPTIRLHGIGTGGDNTNPNLSGNLNPLTQTRVVTVELYNTSGTLVTSVQGNIVYSASNGYFSGDIKLDSTVTAGDYLIKIKADKYLRRKLNGIITITKGTTIQMPEATLITGDSNGDGVLSILDYNIIIDCYSDLLPAKNCTDPAKKLKADISDDGKVNHDDYTLLLRELSVVTGD